MEPQVAARLEETEAAVLASPQSDEAWGRFGMVNHAHELWKEAADAYRKAEELDPSDERWPYYLGDVLSVVGTDLDAAEAAFRRAMALKASYGPAHMRLGHVLVSNNKQDEAAGQFQRALELEPELQPAKVALAQIRLAQAQFDEAEELLDEVLAESPKHGQALTALGQVYMRQGRLDEARVIAERARDPASYNLYSDPLMGRVVAEGVSSVQIWERAKSFLENRNYEQAAIGLSRVVQLSPENAEAHLQLAVAFGHLDQLDRARYHLEQAVGVSPDALDPRLRLGSLALDTGDAAGAIPHLMKVLELAPAHPVAPWMLGRALALSGDATGAVVAFESAASRKLEAPPWVHNEWGSALAQTGRPREALEHFRATLEVDPANAQAHFYSGLVLEGMGRVDDAVASYCRSMAAEANPPSAGRLQALAQDCG
ncbi:MAG: tetratricopeptide repeat protein [Thermoanaerobaculia bacterium]